MLTGDSDTNECFDTRPDVLVYFIFLSKYLIDM